MKFKPNKNNMKKIKEFIQTPTGIIFLMTCFIVVLYLIFCYPKFESLQNKEQNKDMIVSDTLISLYYWDDISESFKLNENYFELIKIELKIVLADKPKIKFDELNKQHILFMESKRLEYDIPLSIFYRLVYAESKFKNNLKSPKGAIGYMQIMPSTFNWLKETFNNDLGKITYPYANIDCGAFLLRYLKLTVDKNYPKDSEYKKWKRVLASYNAGYSKHEIALVSFTETKNYVDFIQKKI